MERRFDIVAVCHLLLITLAMALCMALFAGSAEAAVYACPNAQGDTQYQDRPCSVVKPAQAAGSTASNAAGNHSSGQTSAAASEYPLGMHPSWFIPPAHAPQPAYCDRLGCDCATQTRNFRSGLTAAVADALFLESAWHRYAEQVIIMETDPPKGLALLELQVEIEDSACNIQMSQLTVKNYVESALKELKLRAEAAISRGNTAFDQCDGKDAKVCADVDAFSLYERVKLDIETLSLPRYFLIAEAD